MERIGAKDRGRASKTGYSQTPRMTTENIKTNPNRFPSVNPPLPPRKELTNPLQSGLLR